MGSVCDAYDNAMCEKLLRRPRMRDARSPQVQDPRRSEKRGFAFIEGFYNLRCHSSIGYLSPIDYERRHQAVVSNAHQPAALLAPVKDKPLRAAATCGRPLAAAARRSCDTAQVGTEEWLRLGAERKNAAKQEDSMPSTHTA
jgi:hypothetical protein